MWIDSIINAVYFIHLWITHHNGYIPRNISIWVYKTLIEIIILLHCAHKRQVHVHPLHNSREHKYDTRYYTVTKQTTQLLTVSGLQSPALFNIFIHHYNNISFLLDSKLNICFCFYETTLTMTCFNLYLFNPSFLCAIPISLTGPVSGVIRVTNWLRTSQTNQAFAKCLRRPGVMWDRVGVLHIHTYLA